MPVSACLVRFCVLVPAKCIIAHSVGRDFGGQREAIDPDSETTASRFVEIPCISSGFAVSQLRSVSLAHFMPSGSLLRRQWDSLEVVASMGLVLQLAANKCTLN